MHGSAPKLLIIAKREALGDEMPDFSGDSYLDAKKKAVDSDDPPDTKYSEDHHAAMICTMSRMSRVIRKMTSRISLMVTIIPTDRTRITSIVG